MLENNCEPEEISHGSASMSRLKEAMILPPTNDEHLLVMDATLALPLPCDLAHALSPGAKAGGPVRLASNSPFTLALYITYHVFA